MRPIGLHMRIYDTLLDTFNAAHALGLTTFQCFLLHQVFKRHIVLDREEIQKINSMRHLFDDLYIHAAYWINLCDPTNRPSRFVFDKEFKMAKRLQCTHYVLHAGFVTHESQKIAGIDCLVSILDETLRHEHELKIVLENTAHGMCSIGSDIEDLRIIKSKLTHPEKIMFCIDTAHAHVFGYDIIEHSAQDRFIEYICNALGQESLALIHLNDTKEKRGSRHDQHAMLGQGVIGVDALRRFALHKHLRTVPVIFELPPLTMQEQKDVLQFAQDILLKV